MKANYVSWPAGSEVANTKKVRHHLTARMKRRAAYLDDLVPASRDDDGVLRVRAEAHAADPLGVALVGDGELAVAEGVPQLDGAVAGAADDLAVVGGEGDREDVVGVAHETAGGQAGAQLPETESLVPGRGEGVGAVGGDDTVGDDVGMAVQRALWVAVGGVIAGEVPDDEGLVAGAGEEHVGAAKLSMDLSPVTVHQCILLKRGGQAGDPAGVAFEGAAEDELFCHDCGVRGLEFHQLVMIHLNHKFIYAITD